jgi:hypothetical protein
MLRNPQKANERRCRQRFSLNWELQYKVLKKGKAGVAGTGLTSDVSSKGIRFAADRPLPVGAPIEIVINWPAPLGDGRLLQLVGKGRAVRTYGEWVACRIERFEFRTIVETVMPAQARAAVSAG